MRKKLKIETEKQRVRPAGSEVERLLADNRLACEIHEAREEYARGKVRKGTVTELLEDLHQ